MPCRRTTTSQQTQTLATTVTATWWGHTVVPVIPSLASATAGQGLLVGAVTSVPMPLPRLPLWDVKVSGYSWKIHCLVEMMMYNEGRLYLRNCVIFLA